MFLTNLLIAWGLVQTPTISSPLINFKAEICGQMPQGTGLNKNGEGWIHILKTGYYSFPNTQLLNQKKSQFYYLKANTTYFILAHKGDLEWIYSDGKKELVPQNLLFPPYN